VNSSCYLYAWKENLTTLTGNLSLTRVIKEALEKGKSNDGPDMRVIPYRTLTNIIPDMNSSKKRGGEVESHSPSEYFD